MNAASLDPHLTVTTSSLARQRACAPAPSTTNIALSHQQTPSLLHNTFSSSISNHPSFLPLKHSTFSCYSRDIAAATSATRFSLEIASPRSASKDPTQLTSVKLSIIKVSHQMSSSCTSHLPQASAIDLRLDLEAQLCLPRHILHLPLSLSFLPHHQNKTPNATSNSSSNTTNTSHLHKFFILTTISSNLIPSSSSSSPLYQPLFLPLLSHSHSCTSTASSFNS